MDWYSHCYTADGIHSDINDLSLINRTEENTISNLFFNQFCFTSEGTLIERGLWMRNDGTIRGWSRAVQDTDNIPNFEKFDRYFLGSQPENGSRTCTFRRGVTLFEIHARGISHDVGWVVGSHEKGDSWAERSQGCNGVGCSCFAVGFEVTT